MSEQAAYQTRSSREPTKTGYQNLLFGVKRKEKVTLGSLFPRLPRIFRVHFVRAVIKFFDTSNDRVSAEIAFFLNKNWVFLTLRSLSRWSIVRGGIFVADFKREVNDDE
jgi:hypothetical protein